MEIKKLLEMDLEDFDKIITEEEYDRMQQLGIDFTWQLLDLMKDGAIEVLKTDCNATDFVSIDEYLEYLEEINQINEDIEM